MSSKHIGADLVYAWPTAEIAVMGPDGAINIIFRKEIAKAKDADKKRAQLVKEYREQVIFPRETRPLICKGLDLLASKRQSRPPKKHGNIPL